MVRRVVEVSERARIERGGRAGSLFPNAHTRPCRPLSPTNSRAQPPPTQGPPSGCAGCGHRNRPSCRRSRPWRARRGARRHRRRRRTAARRLAQARLQMLLTVQDGHGRWQEQQQAQARPGPPARRQQAQPGLAPPAHPPCHAASSPSARPAGTGGTGRRAAPASESSAWPGGQAPRALPRARGGGWWRRPGPSILF